MNDNQIDFESYINNAINNSNGKLVIENFNGKKVTITVEDTKNNYDSKDLDFMANYIFFILIVIVLLCFFIGVIFKNKKILLTNKI